MNIKDNPAIYLMPGMAASPKIFTLFSLSRGRTGASKGRASVIIF